MTIAALMLSGLSSYDRARAAVETWGKQFEILEVHSFSPDPLGQLPIRKVGDREGPRSCFRKRLDGIELVRRCESYEDIGPSADWFLFCSDDNFIFKENLERALRDLVAPIDRLGRRPLLVGGHTNQLRIADGTLVTYPSGGAGYLLNRDAFEIISDMRNMIAFITEWDRRSNHDDVEDAFMGFACNMLNIPYLALPGFYGCNPLEKNCERHCVAIDRPISFHRMTAEQIRELHQQRR